VGSHALTRPSVIAAELTIFSHSIACRSPSNNEWMANPNRTV
jgi:hypothetical protein